MLTGCAQSCAQWRTQGYAQRGDFRSVISSVLTGVIKLCVFRGTALSGVVKNVLCDVPRVCSWICSDVCA